MVVCPLLTFLFRMNMGPDKPCIFCGLSQESINHLFCYCSKVSSIWSQLCTKIGTHISFPFGFKSGAWITDSNYSMYIISVITTTAWFIWKSRCDAIFRNVNPNYPVIAHRALAHVQDHFNYDKRHLGQRLILNNFSNADGQFLFNHTCFNQCTKVSAIGFFFSKSNYTVSIAGYYSQPSTDISPNNLLVLETALLVALDNSITIHHIFNQNISTGELITNLTQPQLGASTT